MFKGYEVSCGKYQHRLSFTFTRCDRKMLFMDDFIFWRGKNKIYTIGALHCVMVCIGIWSLVAEMIELEEPVTSYDLIYTGIHYTVHFILIFCLFIGAYVDIPFFLIPWLSATFMVFLYTSVLTIMSLENWTLYDILIHLMNFSYLGICWFIWYVAFSYVTSTYRKGKMCQNKHLLE